MLTEQNMMYILIALIALFIFYKMIGHESFKTKCPRCRTTDDGALICGSTRSCTCPSGYECNSRY